MTERVDLLERAGFTEAVKQVKQLAERARGLAIAYEHYRYVSQEAIDAFNTKLSEETIKRSGKAGKNLVERYDKLVFTPIGKYAKVPPVEVLEAALKAGEHGVFDVLEVASIESVHDYKDPLLFGRVEGCSDRFFIAQWGDDVKIEDLLGEGDG